MMGIVRAIDEKLTRELLRTGGFETDWFFEEHPLFALALLAAVLLAASAIVGWLE